MSAERGVDQTYGITQQHDTAHLLPKPGENTSLLLPTSARTSGAAEPFFDTNVLYQHPESASRPAATARTASAKETGEERKLLADTAKDERACEPAFKPSADQDMEIDGATRRKVINSLAKDLKEHYIFPEQADEAIKAIRKFEANGKYDRLTSAKDFSERLSSDLQQTAHDKHLRVRYREELDDPNKGGPSPEDLAAQIKFH